MAFGRHLGVLRALEERGIRPTRISGVSSGALVGALWAAGHSSEVILEMVRRVPPRAHLSWRFPWGKPGFGLFSLEGLIRLLEEYLPLRMEDLPMPFSVGVVEARTEAPVLLETGPLAESVAASCAVPWLFAPQKVGEAVYADGGAVDRLFLAPLLGRHPSPLTLVHLVGSSRARAEERGQVVRKQLEEAPRKTRLVRVDSPPSGASLWSLGDVEVQVEEGRLGVGRVLAGVGI